MAKEEKKEDKKSAFDEFKKYAEEFDKAIQTPDGLGDDRSEKKEEAKKRLYEFLKVVDSEFAENLKEEHKGKNLPDETARALVDQYVHNRSKEFVRDVKKTGVSEIVKSAPEGRRLESLIGNEAIAEKAGEDYERGARDYVGKRHQIKALEGLKGRAEKGALTEEEKSHLLRISAEAYGEERKKEVESGEYKEMAEFIGSLAERTFINGYLKDEAMSKYHVKGVKRELEELKKAIEKSGLSELREKAGNALDNLLDGDPRERSKGVNALYGLYKIAA